MDFKFQRRWVTKIPEVTILEELQKATQYYEYIEFGRDDFDKVADISISSGVVRKHFDGSWKNALKKLKSHLQQQGLTLRPRPCAPNRVLSDTELFDELERIWKIIGQRPSQGDWKKNNPKHSYATYKKRFGGWTQACLKFIEYKMGEGILSDDFVLPERVEQKTNQDDKTEQKKEKSRSVSDRLRLEVLNRDNFCCVFCGKSPANDIGAKLHIDHIKPFSRGGESTLENLQTLCKECNLGKGNLMDINTHPTQVKQTDNAK